MSDGPRAVDIPLLAGRAGIKLTNTGFVATATIEDLVRLVNIVIEDCAGVCDKKTGGRGAGIAAACAGKIRSMKSV